MSAGRIVHVIGTLAAGGAERFVVSLLCELRRRAWEVELIAVSERSDAAGRRMRDELADAGVPVHFGPTASVRLRSMFWYVSQMRRLRPEIVHLHNINAETFQMFVPPPWRPAQGLVRTVHTMELDTKDMDGFSLRRSDVACTVFCSEASLERNRDLVRGPVQVIPNAVRLERPVRTPELSLGFKRKLGVDPKLLHFLHVGRMQGDDPAKSPKAHDVLLEAWRLSGVADRGARLHLLGEGSLRPRLEAEAPRDGSVRFHGVRPDVADWLLAADCYLMPSRWEGLPIAGIEAVTAGLPCIFTRIGPLEELRPPLALWCRVDDPADLAARLREFVDEPRAPAPAEVEDVRARFGIARAADAYADMYRALGASPGAAAAG